jgi:hypothetical protein
MRITSGTGGRAKPRTSAEIAPARIASIPPNAPAIVDTPHPDVLEMFYTTIQCMASTLIVSAVGTYSNLKIE